MASLRVSNIITKQFSGHSGICFAVFANLSLADSNPCSSRADDNLVSAVPYKAETAFEELVCAENYTSRPAGSTQAVIPTCSSV